MPFDPKIGHFIGPNFLENRVNRENFIIYRDVSPYNFATFLINTAFEYILTCVVKIEMLTSVFFTMNTHFNQVLKMTALQNANKENLDSLDFSS